MTGPMLADGLYEIPRGKLADVVTSLERRQPPGAAPVDRPDCRLRREPWPALDWYRALFRRIGAPWLWSSRLLLDDGALAAIIRHPDVAVFTMEFEGQDQALLELDFRGAGECELAFFGLAPGLTGQGLGRWLMDHALHQAWARPIKRLWVHTCTHDHPAALPFYISSGFVPFRRQVGVADDPRQTGLYPPEAAPQVPAL